METRWSLAKLEVSRQELECQTVDLDGLINSKDGEDGEMQGRYGACFIWAF